MTILKQESGHKEEMDGNGWTVIRDESGEIVAKSIDVWPPIVLADSAPP